MHVTPKVYTFAPMTKTFPWKVSQYKTFNPRNKLIRYQSAHERFEPASFSCLGILPVHDPIIIVVSLVYNDWTMKACIFTYLKE